MQGKITPSAIIIKGNPSLVANNPKADAFYKELANFLEELGFFVEFDPGEEYTTPKNADVWIGHSRGADRLRFAPKETITIGIGVPESTVGNNFFVVNHPDDKMTHRTFHKGEVVRGKNDALDDDNHYALTPKMKIVLKKILVGGIIQKKQANP